MDALSIDFYYDVKRGQFNDVIYLHPPDKVLYNGVQYEWDEFLTRIRETLDYYMSIDNGIITGKLLFSIDRNNIVYSQQNNEVYLINEGNVMIINNRLSDVILPLDS
jgi:hypothetical protein